MDNLDYTLTVARAFPTKRREPKREGHEREVASRQGNVDLSKVREEYRLYSRRAVELCQDKMASLLWGDDESCHFQREAC
jgi:hypothetical protein